MRVCLTWTKKGIVFPTSEISISVDITVTHYVTEN